MNRVNSSGFLRSFSRGRSARPASCQPIVAMLAVFVLALARVSLGALAEDFKAQYPAAEARLREAYRHVKVTGTHTIYGANERPTIVTREEEIQDGDFVRDVTTSVQNPKPDWPPGSTTVLAGTAQDFFHLSKAAGAPAYKVTSRGPSPQFDQTVRLAFPGLARAFSTSMGAILPRLGDPESRLVSAATTQLDGRDVTEIVYEQSMRGRTLEHHFYFEPHTWALAGWRDHFGPMVAEGRVEYETASDPPKIKSVHEWMETPQRPGVKGNEFRWDFDSVVFGPTPKEQYTLAAFGIQDAPLIVLRPDQMRPPAQVRPPTQVRPLGQVLPHVERGWPRARRWILIGSLLVLVMLLASIVVATRRRKPGDVESRI